MLIHFYLPHKNTKRISSPWLKIAINANQTRKRLHDNFQGARRETKQVPKIYRARLRAYILSELIFYILFFIYCHVLQFLLTPLKPFNINGFSDLVISQIHPRCRVSYTLHAVSCTLHAVSCTHNVVSCTLRASSRNQSCLYWKLWLPCGIIREIDSIREKKGCLCYDAI